MTPRQKPSHCCPETSGGGRYSLRAIVRLRGRQVAIRGSLTGGDMTKTRIMDIEISKNEDGTIKIWFIAIAGEHGPVINLPLSLAQELWTKLSEYTPAVV